jgi:hypothetical protein
MYISINNFLSLSFWLNPSIKMGGMDRCGILFYAGSTTTDMWLLMVAPAPRLLPHETFINNYLVLCLNVTFISGAPQRAGQQQGQELHLSRAAAPEKVFPDQGR